MAYCLQYLLESIFGCNSIYIMTVRLLIVIPFKTWSYKTGKLLKTGLQEHLFCGFHYISASAITTENIFGLFILHIL